MEKRICELFAGVGGFRLGFERLGTGWKTVWYNQWEPGARVQWAHQCYVRRFGDAPDRSGEYHTCEDIAAVNKEAIPDHTLLTAGFPCQDFSVMRSAAPGIVGPKGILWWQIWEVLRIKRPPFCLFENVDRLLRSPAKQRGRDFGIILASLRDLDYDVQWRVVNAALYGAPQRRRRVFLFACHKSTVCAAKLAEEASQWLLTETGFMARAFPVEDVGHISWTRLPDDREETARRFAFPFENVGCMRNGTIFTAAVRERVEPMKQLGSILEQNVDESRYIPAEKLERWKYQKGAKRIRRTSSGGYAYTFSEGAVAFPDPLDKPGRTMLTSEASLNRSSHVVVDPGTGRLRVLTPVEAERMQGFDDGWTDTGMPNRMRYFCMGNALVVPMITRMGGILDVIYSEESSAESGNNQAQNQTAA